VGYGTASRSSHCFLNVPSVNNSDNANSLESGRAVSQHAHAKAMDRAMSGAARCISKKRDAKEQR
jgi:hypothetical protein